MKNENVKMTKQGKNMKTKRAEKANNRMNEVKPPPRGKAEVWTTTRTEKVLLILNRQINREINLIRIFYF